MLNDMAGKDNGTETHIKETAKRVYLKEGRFDATTQDIADAAGVNRTLLHYYFRSRDILLERVLLDGHLEFRSRIAEVMDPNADFKEKLGVLIDVWQERGKEYPYLDAFLVSNLHKGSFLESLLESNKARSKESDAFYEEIENEMKKGTIPSMDPSQFFLNLVSMMSYPITMRPLMERSLFLRGKSYNKILSDRKDAILKMLLR